MLAIWYSSLIATTISVKFSDISLVKYVVHVKEYAEVSKIKKTKIAKNLSPTFRNSTLPISHVFLPNSLPFPFTIDVYWSFLSK